VIVIDTNVLSALMRKIPEPSVVAWLDRQAAESIWITSITLFEARLGLALLPKGKRRQALQSAFDKLLVEDLEGRVLDLDQPAAEAAAQLAAGRQRDGQTIDVRDTQIAGIVRDTQIAGIVIARRAQLATRNVKHFFDLDVKVIDPWDVR
jgi:predicted nucleic acid-binding protein